MFLIVFITTIIFHEKFTITVAIATVFGSAGPFFRGVNYLHVACSGLRPAVVTAVIISHYLKLRNRISSQVVCL